MDTRRELRRLVARRKGQNDGSYRSTIRNAQMVFVKERQMSKFNKLEKSKRQQAEEAKKTVQIILNKDYVVFGRPNIIDPQYRNDRGVVNINAYNNAVRDWNDQISDVVEAITEYNRHVPRREEIRFNSDWATTGSLIAYTKRGLKRA